MLNPPVRASRVRVRRTVRLRLVADVMHHGEPREHVLVPVRGCVSLWCTVRSDVCGGVSTAPVFVRWHRPHTLSARVRASLCAC
jgi:hypothetical protein